MSDSLEPFDPEAYAAELNARLDDLDALCRAKGFVDKALVEAFFKQEFENLVRVAIVRPLVRRVLADLPLPVTKQ